MIMTYEDMMTLTHCHDHILTENIWFVWFVKWRNGDVTDAEHPDSATQPMNG